MNKKNDSSREYPNSGKRMAIDGHSAVVAVESLAGKILSLPELAAGYALSGNRGSLLSNGMSICGQTGVFSFARS